MICVKCRRDFGGYSALASHMAEEHKKKVPVGFEKPFLPNKPKPVVLVLVETGDDLIPLNRVDDDRSNSLKLAGFDTYEKIASATQKQLTDISGIGRATAKAIKASAEELLNASNEQGTQGANEEVQEGS